MTNPSKQEFANLINQLTGNQEMTEQKLDRILLQAKRAYRRDGLPGFFAYVRSLIQAPVSNEYMQQLMKQLQDPAYADQLLKRVKANANSQPRKSHKKKRR